jgi:hypothetical protein
MKKQINHEKPAKRILPGAIAIAFFASILVYVILINMEKKAFEASPKELVLMSKMQVEAGILLTQGNWEQYFHEVEMDQTLIPPAAIRQADELLGKATAHKLDLGVIPTDSMFVTPNEQLATMTDPVIVAFGAQDLAQVTNGILRGGDFIHLYLIRDDGEVLVLAKQVIVWQVFDAAGGAIQPGDTLTPAVRINLLMEEGSLEELYTQMTQGDLRVVKVT